MTHTTSAVRRWATVFLMVPSIVGLCSASASAQIVKTASIRVDAVFGDRVKVVFDRTSVSLDTTAFDPGSVVPVSATPLTVTAKARVTGNARVLLTVQADGPLTSGVSTIPANKVTWTTTGPGFQTSGTANVNAPRIVGQWRGSGIWTGSQTYKFTDDWTYAVGAYTMTMTYTMSMP